MYGSLPLSTTLPKFLGLRYFRPNSQDRLHQEVQQMIVIAPYLQARRRRHASLYLVRLGGPAPDSPRDRRAASLLDIRRRLDTLRRCRVRQESVARSNALLFACLLRHGAPDAHQAIVLRWFVRHARLTAARHSPLPRARRSLRLRVTGVLAAWHLAPGTVVWWLDQREVLAFRRVIRCYLAVNRSVRRFAASEFA